jgi:TolB-like protein/Tfp pilus assembly protein PilF
VSAPRIYEFGRFRLDAGVRLLFRDRERLALTPKAVELLIALVEARETPLTREDLLHKIWADAVVEEGTLTSHISLLRKALGDEHIETLPKRGYRFVGSVRELTGAPARAVHQRVMLVVLPFENISGGDKHDYFSEGLTEEMITQLARLSPENLGVIARTSSMQYKSTSKTVQQIGRELGVSYALEGSVRRYADRVRITAQLIQASDESHAWADTYERNLGDILSLQTEVAQAIARQIQIKLTPSEQKRLHDSRSMNPQAYEAYLKGRYFWYKRTEEGMRKSIESFQQAIERDPNYAAAYDGISDAYVMLACRGVVPVAEAFHKAKAAARRALQIDHGLGEAYASLAHVRLHDWDWIGLEEDFQRALDLNSGHTIAHYWYAEYLMARGRSEESVTRVRYAQALDPINPVLNASVGMILYLARRSDEAVEELRKALEVDPGHFLLHFRLGLVYCQRRQMVQEAVHEMEMAVALSGRSTETLTGLAQACGIAGDLSAMQKIVDELKVSARYVSPYDVARTYACVRDKELSFAWLEKAYREHNPDLIELNMEPSFDTIRSDSRFTDLLRRIDLPLS